MNFTEETNTDQLLKVLNKLFPKYSNHVVALDELKKLEPKMGQNIIINFDKSTGPGIHWVAVTIREEAYAVFYDSFAVEPHREILQFMKKAQSKGIVRDTVMNTHQVQTFKQSACGWYCLYFMNNYINKRMQAWKATTKITHKGTISFAKRMFKLYLKK